MDIFKEAMKRAKKKQMRIFLQTENEYVLQNWYLNELICEAYTEISLENFCKSHLKNNFKKEIKNV